MLRCGEALRRAAEDVLVVADLLHPLDKFLRREIRSGVLDRLHGQVDDDLADRGLNRRVNVVAALVLGDPRGCRRPCVFRVGGVAEAGRIVALGGATLNA